MTYDPSHPVQSHRDHSNDELINSFDPASRHSINNPPLDLEQINRSTPPYLSAYGLAEAPFSQQHNDRFLYLSSELSEQLELLKHYTQYGNLLLIVSGEHGIGKSSLKQRFINTALEEWKICNIQADTMMDASLLLRQIAMGFGITEPPLEPSVLFEVLNSQLEHLHSESYEPILIIDDAHELPQEALQSLLYLAEHSAGQESSLRIILFCEPVIEVMLEAPAIRPLKDKVTHNIKIPAFDEIQTAEYLKHRLAVAGFDGASPFTPMLIHKIHTYAAGIPSKINEAAHQNLLDDSEPEIEEVLGMETKLASASSLFTPRNIIIGSIASLIILSVLIFQEQINDLFEEKNTPVEASSNDKQAEVNSIAENKVPVLLPAENEKTTIEFSLNSEPERNTPEQEQTSPLAEEKTEAVITTEKVIEPALSKTAIELKSVNPSPVPPSRQRQIISITGQGFDKRQKVKISWSNNGQEKEKILSDNQVNVTSDSYMNLIVNVGMQSGIWKVTVIDPVDKTQSNTINFNVVANDASSNKLQPLDTTNKTSASKVNGIYSDDWIREQNKNNFTLQLLATHNAATAKNYLKKFSLKEDAAIFKLKRNGENWYTLLYGNYPSKSLAQTAANKLPRGVSKPWLRSFASVVSTLAKPAQPIKQATTAKRSPSLNNAIVIPENTASWLWSQDPRHYTLQLLAGGSKQAIQSYIQRYKLKGKAAQFHSLRDGKDWYILLYGSYDGYSKAKQAVEQLPLAIRKSKPWPRRFSAIHAELN